MIRREIRGLRLDPIAEARRRAGHSRNTLARLAGVSATTIQNIEEGRVEDPNIETVAKLCAALKIPMREVVRVPPKQRTLADLRHLAGHSQTTLARRSGLSPTAVAYLERGETQLTDEKAARLAPLLNTTPNQLRQAWQRARNRAPGAPA